MAKSSFSDDGAERIRLAFDYHRAHPEISFDEHVRQKKIQLGASLARLQAIYLDTRYWIFLRDAYLGRPQNALHIQLLDILRGGVEMHRIYCPISDATLIELLKRSGQERKAVMTLVDELSLGVAFAPEEERVGTELAHFLHSAFFPDEVYPLNWLVWNRVVYTLGIASPSVTWLDAAENQVMQKAFFDHLWDIPLTEVMEIAGLDKDFPHLPLDELAQRLTALNAKYSGELTSYKQTYSREIWGAIDLILPKVEAIMVPIVNRLRKSDGSTPNSIGIESQIEARLSEVFRHGNVAKVLPTLHVMAHCHASIRHDKRRPMKANDLPDFHHASAALVYCKAFFTENPLRILLTSPQAKLDKEYNCRVISDINEAIDFLRAENW